MRVVNKTSSKRDGRVCKDEWILCPVCANKTRVKVRNDTVLENFPLFCPKCKQETIINVKELNMSVIKEPDAKTQSR
ncbi:cysteine-rich KTR domain-containing protein [Paenibacillus sp. FSL H3-0321]